MERRDIAIFLAVLIGAAAVLAGIVIALNGTSNEHLDMGNYDKIADYDGLYVIDLYSIKETNSESIVPNSFIIMGDRWLSDNWIEAPDLMREWLGESSTLIVLNSSSSAFEPLKGELAMDFDPLAQINALYVSDGCSYCLSLTCDTEWKWKVVDESWKTDDMAKTVNPVRDPCCVSTVLYQKGDNPEIRSTNAFWKVAGQYMPVCIWIDGEAVWIEPKHGFYAVNFLEFTSNGHSMSNILYRISTGGYVHYQFPCTVTFYEDTYGFSMPVANNSVYWSLPSQTTGPISYGSDIDGEYGVGYNVDVSYRFFDQPTAIPSGDFMISSGGSFELLNESIATYDGKYSTGMNYHKEYSRFIFDICTEFSVPVEKE